MGNLTNQYVSQSFQGLIKLADSTTGVTATLQYVQDGLGNNIPMQVSTSSVVITGSLIGTASYATQALSASYAPDTTNTGSLVSTSSFNAYTSSNDSKVNSLIAATGSFVTETESGSFMITGSVAGDTLTFTKGNGSQFSLQVNTGSLPSGVISGSQQITNLGFATTSSVNQKLDTGSFNTYTSSNDSKVNSLINATGSYATTSSVTSLSQSIAVTDLAQNNRLNSIEGVTGSFVTETESGSFMVTGSASGNVLTFTKGNGTTFNLSVDTGSNSNRNGLITTGSVAANQSITGSVNISGTITATSASFTYVNTVYETASVIYSSGSNQFGDASNDTQTLWGTVVLPSGPLVITGSVTASAGFVGNLTGTASYATNALSASYAPMPSVAGFATTGSNTFTGQQTINNYAGFIINDPTFTAYAGVDFYTGGTGTQGQFTSTADRTYIQSKNDLYIQSNLGGATTGSIYATSNKDLTLNAISGTTTVSSSVVNIIAPNVKVTGSLSVSAGITGSLEGTASFATNAGSASYAPTVIPNWVATTGSNTFTGAQTINNDLTISSTNPFGTFVNMTSTGTTSFNMNSPTTQFQSNGLIAFTNTLSSTGSSDITFLTQNGGDIILNTSNSGSVAITGSVNISGSVVDIKAPIVIITGSLILSGSAGVELDVKGDQAITGSLNITGSVNITGSLFEKGNLYVVNPNMTGTFAKVSSSYAGNVLFGWDGITGAEAVSTSSYVISGSNNILKVIQTVTAAGYYNYISGSNNISLGGQGITLSTGSILRPVTSNNTINGNGSAILTFISSSVAGGQPSFSNNIVNASTTINMGSSGSITATGNIINGATSLLQTGSAIANLRSTFNNNNINSTFFVQNYVSSSFTVSNNNTVGATHYIDNYWVNGFATAGAVSSRNLFQGQSNFITLSGSPSSNTSRAVSDNFLGGNTVNINASVSGSNAGNSYGTIIYGYNLQANANATGIDGGSGFFGRFNDTGSLANTKDIVFAVGTGTAAATRRTGLYITSGSLVGVSGSMNVIGNTTMTGSLNVSADILFASGSNKTMGTFVLDGANPGAATVSNSLVTTSSLIFLTKQTNTNSGNGTVSVTSKGAGTFNVTSNHNGDTDTVAYLIINPA